MKNICVIINCHDEERKGRLKRVRHDKHGTFFQGFRAPRSGIPRRDFLAYPVLDDLFCYQNILRDISIKIARHYIWCRAIFLS